MFQSFFFKDILRNPVHNTLEVLRCVVSILLLQGHTAESGPTRTWQQVLGMFQSFFFKDILRNYENVPVHLRRNTCFNPSSSRTYCGMREKTLSENVLFQFQSFFFKDILRNRAATSRFCPNRFSSCFNPSSSRTYCGIGKSGSGSTGTGFVSILLLQGHTAEFPRHVLTMRTNSVSILLLQGHTAEYGQQRPDGAVRRVSILLLQGHTAEWLKIYKVGVFGVSFNPSSSRTYCGMRRGG